MLRNPIPLFLVVAVLSSMLGCTHESSENQQPLAHRTSTASSDYSSMISDSSTTTAPVKDAGSSSLPIQYIYWKAPAQRVSGEALSGSEISHFEIWFGEQPQRMEFYASTPYSRYPLNALPDGDYYLAVLAVDVEGRKSDFAFIKRSG